MQANLTARIFCFDAGPGDYASFIEEESDIKCMPGNFILEDGEVVGKHKGITHYTIGQRKRLRCNIW